MRLTVAITMGPLLAGVLAVPAEAAPGDMPSQVPTTFTSMTTTLKAKKTYGVGCFDSSVLTSGFFGDGPQVMMFAYSLTTPKGKRISTFFEFRDALNNLYVSGSASGNSQTQVLQRYQPQRQWGYTYWTLRPSTTVVFRAGYAAWGQDALCFISDGQMLGFAKLFTEQKPAKARVLFPTQFSGGATVSSSHVQASVLQSYVRSVSGYAFAVFKPGNGLAKITDPKGKVRYDTQSGTGSPQVAEVTKGKWTYSLDGAYRQDGTPVLWVMDLPK